ncbi:beta-1,3-galactosyltransferase 1 [Ceratitis capitata]|uniref:beta-1,3-galactosyltransferase 1 n=1 Tax=Ceratitis capitata TaxID=7213 RepID=UPI0006188250|nr:beta-1,3-galactosyltransferase 1 [Ceratitis capitata]
MPVSNTASIFTGILVGLVAGYALWECASSFIPALRNQKIKTQGTIKMSLQPLVDGEYRESGQLIDLYNFSYIMNQPSCTANIHALVLIHTAPGNQDRRKLIRQTWANFVELPLHKNSIPFRVIFLLGLPETEANQSELERENFEYDDMVQGSFVDTYNNLTYKHVMAMKWFLTYCSDSKILIKVDDDIFLNTPQLMIYLHNTMLHDQLPQTGKEQTPPVESQPDRGVANNSEQPLKLLLRKPRDVLFCNRKVNVTVRSNPSDYPHAIYPPYCPGFAIVYSVDVVKRLYAAAQKTKAFWIDDIHITGILAKKLGISIRPAQAFTTICNSHQPICNSLLEESGRARRERANLDPKEYLFTLQPKSFQMHTMWQMQLKRLKEYILKNIQDSGAHIDAVEG